MIHEQQTVIAVAVGLPVVLLAAYLIGQLARWLLRGRVTLATGTTIVLSVLGISGGLLIGALVFDDDILNMLTWVDGELVDDLCVPDPVEHFGPEAAAMAEIAEFGDLAELGIDAGAMGLGPSTSAGHDARRL